MLSVYNSERKFCCQLIFNCLLYLFFSLESEIIAQPLPEQTQTHLKSRTKRKKKKKKCFTLIKGDYVEGDLGQGKENVQSL